MKKMNIKTASLTGKPNVDESNSKINTKRYKTAQGNANHLESFQWKMGIVLKLRDSMISSIDEKALAAMDQ